MSVSPSDLLSPTGPIERRFFPGEDVEGDTPPTTVLEERLQTYINQAVTKVTGVGFTDVDAATTLWALHLAFEAAYLVAVSRPSSSNAQVPVLGSDTFSKDQRDALKAKAEEYEALYSVMRASVPTTQAPKGAPTRMTTNTFAW